MTFHGCGTRREDRLLTLPKTRDFRDRVVSVGWAFRIGKSGSPLSRLSSISHDRRAAGPLASAGSPRVGPSGGPGRPVHPWLRLAETPRDRMTTWPGAGTVGPVGLYRHSIRGIEPLGFLEKIAIQAPRFPLPRLLGFDEQNGLVHRAMPLRHILESSGMTRAEAVRGSRNRRSRPSSRASGR